MKDNRLTLVTGYWPQKHEIVRTGHVYARLFEELLIHVDDKLPIVCLVDPYMEAEVRAVKSRHPNVRLEIVPMAFEELYFARDRTRLADLQPANNSITIRDTIEYAIIMWSKPDAVLRTAIANPFGTSHFAWIDFGIAHVVELLGVDWAEIEEETVRTDRLRLGERMATSKAEVEDPWFFYSANSGRVCGGFMTGTRERFEELAALFDAEVSRMIPTGTYAVDEQILAAATALMPDKIERWYCDYYGLLPNVVRLRRDAETVISNLKHCASESLWENGVDIAKYLLASGEAYLHLSPEHCFHLLDSGLACALHHDHDLAQQLAKTALSLYHYSRVGRGMMKGAWRKSLQTSLQALDMKFSDKPWTWDELSSQPDFRVWMSCF